MRKIWPFTFYFLYFAALSSLMPYFVLFYQELGFSGTEIGLLTGIPPLITLIAAPFWTGIADTRHWHKLIMGLGITFAATAIFLVQSFTSFLVVFAIIVFYNIFLSPVSPLADSATMAMLGEDRAMYGRIRLGGTIGWGIYAPIAGALVQRYGLKLAFWSFSSIMLINLLISQKFAHGSQGDEAAKSGGIRVLLTSRRWINFLFLAFLGGLGSAAVSSYLFPYMKELGANESTMGLALTISTLTEIPIFFFGNRLVKKFGSYGLLVLALFLMSIRSLLFATFRDPWLVLTVQGLGGMLFPAMWLAGVSYAHENTPAGLKSTGQGLFGAMSFGVGAAGGGFIGGLLLGRFGGRGVFLALGFLVLGGLVLAEGIRYFFPDKNDLPRVVPLPNDK